MEDELTENSGSQRSINIGDTVSVVFDTGTTLAITIKTPEESNPKNCIVSFASPIGRALLDKKEGELFQYFVDGRIFCGKIEKILSA